MNLIRLCDYSV